MKETDGKPQMSSHCSDTLTSSSHWVCTWLDEDIFRDFRYRGAG